MVDSCQGTLWDGYEIMKFPIFLSPGRIRAEGDVVSTLPNFGDAEAFDQLCQGLGTSGGGDFRGDGDAH